MLLYSLVAIVVVQARIIAVIVVRTAKQPTAYFDTKRKREAKQKSRVLTNPATRKVAKINKATRVRHIDTAHFPLGANGFGRNARIVISMAKTTCMYGASKMAFFSSQRMDLPFFDLSLKHIRCFLLGTYQATQPGRAMCTLL